MYLYARELASEGRYEDLLDQRLEMTHSVIDLYLLR